MQWSLLASPVNWSLPAARHSLRDSFLREHFSTLLSFNICVAIIFFFVSSWHAKSILLININTAILPRHLRSCIIIILKGLWLPWNLRPPPTPPTPFAHWLSLVRSCLPLAISTSVTCNKIPSISDKLIWWWDNYINSIFFFQYQECS